MEMTDKMKEFFFNHILNLSVNGIDTVSDGNLSVECFEQLKADMIESGIDEIVEDFAMYLMYVGYMRLVKRMEEFMKKENITAQDLREEIMN